MTQTFKGSRLARMFLPLVLVVLGATGVLVNLASTQAAPDLTVASVDVSAVTTDCRTRQLGGTATAVVTNAGGAETGSGFTVLFFEDRNGNGQFDAAVDLVLGSSVQVPLGAGESATASASVAGTVMFNGNLIYALADSGNQVAETNESNNISNSGLACTYTPMPGAFSPVLKWSWTSSAVLPTSLNVMMTPAVIDLNEDGIPDVVFGSTGSTGGGYVEVGVLRALNGLDGSELFTVTDTSYQISTTSSLAVGDLDLDGKPEIVACDASGARLIVFEHDGTFKWRSPNLEAVYWGAPAIADLDGDGTPEIVIGRQVLNNNGTIRWTGTGGRGSQGSIGALALVADINLDGSPEVVAGNTAYTAAGAILWRNTTLPDGYNAVADFDGDGFPEIVLVSGGRVWLLEHTGAVKWGPVAILGGGSGGPPTVADYDNDGQVEIGVAGASRYAVFETNGTLKWAAVTQDGSSNVTGSSVFDFEGDGSAEVVYADELNLRIYRGTDGVVLFQTPKSSCTWYEYPLVADVDADGNAEIVAVANNNCGYGPQRGIFVYGDAADNWVPTRTIWNQHTYHITNVNDDGSIPMIEANNWETYNNYRQNVLTHGPAQGAPDLTASYLRLNNLPCPDAVGIVARIGNGGAVVAPALVKAAFYLGDPKAGGVLLGVVPTTHPLNPGAYEDVTLLVSPPLAGDHTIYVVADDDGSGTGVVNECNEANNECHAQLTRFCECVDNLSARPKSGKVQLVWTHTGAAAYDVYRSTMAGGPYLFLAQTTSTYSTYLDLNVVNGTTYFYVVREVSPEGDELCQSNEAAATPRSR